MTHLTRALLRFQRGAVAGALADADVVAGDSPEAADSLRSYAALVFRATTIGRAASRYRPIRRWTASPSRSAMTSTTSATSSACTPPG
jgi:hypothetical protein